MGCKPTDSIHKNDFNKIGILEHYFKKFPKNQKIILFNESLTNKDILKFKGEDLNGFEWDIDYLKRKSQVMPNTLLVEFEELLIDSTTVDFLANQLSRKHYFKKNEVKKYSKNILLVKQKLTEFIQISKPAYTEDGSYAFLFIRENSKTDTNSITLRIYKKTESSWEVAGVFVIS